MAFNSGTDLAFGTDGHHHRRHTDALSRLSFLEDEQENGQPSQNVQVSTPDLSSSSPQQFPLESLQTPSHLTSESELRRPYDSSTLLDLHSTHRPSDAGLLPDQSPSSVSSPEYEGAWAPQYKRKSPSWPSVAILVLSIYSTAMSTLFLAVALLAPRYGRLINSNGLLTISGATVVTTFLAKTIEFSFVTVIVACLGQILARRAHNERKEKGVTLAEISMRYWILQPGTMFLQWSSMRYAALTTLGILSLLTTITSLLYVTAANALVQPQLKLGDWESREMQTLVKTSFANTDYMYDDCLDTMSLTLVDCMELQFASRASHNLFTYLSMWNVSGKDADSATNLAFRPKGYARLNEKTTVVAPWVYPEFSNTTRLFMANGHLIVNVTMTIPHVGAISAAVDPINNILQADDLDGLGFYRIKAALPSYAVNVMCATLSENDLRPLVVSMMPDCTTLYNASSASASLETTCEDVDSDSHYSRSEKYAPSGNITFSPEFPRAFGVMFRGLTVGNGTQSRLGILLNSLVALTPSLNASWPSTAEVLAVIAGGSVLHALKDSSALHYWNYTLDEGPLGILGQPRYESFNASIQDLQYASGGTAPYQKGFLVILLLTSLLNLIALAYFLTHRNWYEDISEPSALFGLAINSPPNERFANNGGKPPHGKQFRSAWKLREEGQNVYMQGVEIDSDDEGPGLVRRRKMGKARRGFDILLGPVNRKARIVGERLER